MTSAPSSRQAAVRTYADLLVKLHDLIARGEDEGAEADAIRDAMDAPWTIMTPAERDRVSLLSEDLYALAERSSRQIPMSVEQTAQWRRDARTAFDALRAGDYEITLGFLRRPFPQGLPLYTIPFMQARCWEGLGNFEVALPFMREAERLDPSLAICALVLLDKLGRTEEAMQYARRMIANHGSGPEELYLAAASLFAPTRDLDSAQARPILEESVPPLKRALNRARATPPEKLVIPELEPLIALTLGLCHERLGNDPRAVEVYNGTLNRYPSNAELLSARGLARYEHDRAGAIQDLERARKAGVASVWTYYCLAHHALEQEDYLPCWRFCMEGIEYRAPDPIRAQMVEWLGICRSMLGQPQDTVMEAFREAERLDPGNDRIQHNQQLAEKRVSLIPRQALHWKSEPTLRIQQTRVVPRADVDRLQDSLDEGYSGRVAQLLVPA